MCCRPALAGRSTKSFFHIEEICHARFDALAVPWGSDSGGLQQGPAATGGEGATQASPLSKENEGKTKRPPRREEVEIDDTDLDESDDE